MKLTLFGATGATGALILEKALAAGHTVTVVVRSPDRLSIRDERVHVIRGDVLDPAFDLAPAVAGADAVVSSLGIPYTRKPVTIYSEGTRRILEAMQATGVERLIAISSGGTHPGWDRDSPLFFEAILKRVFHGFYADMRRMEELIMASDLDWLILRPPQLLNHPAPGPARERDDAYMVARGAAKISRAALADAVIRHLGPAGKHRVAVALAE